MRRVLSLSIVVGLGVAGHAAAQTRSVSTADMPKPGVSYISGPSVPVRRETVSTATLPQPSHFYVDDRAAPPPQPVANDVPVDSGYYGGYYGGYPPGYGWGNRGHDHGRPDHDHGRPPPPQGTTTTVRLNDGTRFGPPAGGVKMGVAPPPRTPDRHDHGGGWHGGGNPHPVAPPVVGAPGGGGRWGR